VFSVSDHYNWKNYKRKFADYKQVLQRLCKGSRKSGIMDLEKVIDENEA
jgi:hypothetical protein